MGVYRLCVLTLVVLTSSVSLNGQSWGDLAKKAKKKVADKVLQPSASPTPSSGTSSPSSSSSTPANTSESHASTNTSETRSSSSTVPSSTSVSTPKDLSQYETSGPLLYTYCFTIANFPTITKYYVTDIFQIHGPDPGMDTTRYRGKLYAHYADPFKDYVDIKLDAPRKYQSSYGCQDGFKTTELAQKDKTRSMTPSEPSASVVFIETGWKGSNTELNAQDLDPQHRRDVDLQRAINQEHEGFSTNCKASALLSGNLDCTCYSEHMYQARLHANNSVTSGGMQIQPLTRELFPVAHLEACTSREKIEAYAVEQIDKMSLAQNAKDALAACAPPKLATLALANPAALTERHTYTSLNQQAMQSCPLPR